MADAASRGSDHCPIWSSMARKSGLRRNLEGWARAWPKYLSNDERHTRPVGHLDNPQAIGVAVCEEERIEIPVGTASS